MPIRSYIRPLLAVCLIASLLSLGELNAQVAGGGAAVDIDPPAPPVIKPAVAITSEQSVIIEGAAEGGSQVAIWGGREVVFINLPADKTKFRARVILNKNRENNLSITATDKSGNESDPVDFIIEHDDSPPDAPDLSTTARSTNRKIAEINGVAEAGVLLKVEGGRAPVEARLDPGQTNFSLQVPIKTRELNNITIIAIDAAGNRSAPGNVTVVYDDKAPPAPEIEIVEKYVRLRSLTIRGKTEAGSLVQVISDDVEVTSENPIRLAYDRDKFEFQLRLARNTVNNVTIAVTDAAGNVGEPGRISVIHDDTPPEKPLVDPLQPYTQKTMVTISGRAQSGDTVIINAGGEEISNKLKTDLFKFLVPIIPNRQTRFEIYARDAAGNIGAAENRYIIHDDTPPPPPELDPQPPEASSEKTVLFAGRAEKGSQVIITGMAEPFSKKLDPQIEDFSVNLPLNLNVPSEVEVFSIDLAGNKSEVLTYRILHDDVPPLTPTFIEPPKISKEPEIEVRGYSEPGVEVMLEVNARKFKFRLSNRGPGFTIKIPLVADQYNNIISWSVDDAGNRSPKLSFSVIQDSQAPPPPEIISLPQYVRDRKIRLRGFAERGSTVIGSGPSGRIKRKVPEDSINFEFDAKLKSNKENSFILQAVDAAGNISQQALFRTIHDSIPPKRPVLDKIADITNRSRITLSGATEAGAKIKVSGGLREETIQLGPDENRFNIQAYLKRNKKNTLTVTAIDAAGNESSSKTSIVQDDVPPSRPKITNPISLTTKRRIRLDGEAEYNSRVEITGGTEKVSFKVTRRNGDFTSTIELNENTENSISITATDISGNTSMPTRLQITHDDSPPESPVFELYTEHTNRSKMILRGSGERGSRLEIVGAKDKIDIKISDIDANFTVEVAFNKNRWNKMQATLVDDAGNRSTSVPIIIEHDNIAPAMPVLGKIPEFVISSDYDVKGRAEAGTRILITGGQENVSKQMSERQSSFEIPVPLRRNLFNTIAVFSIDAADNKSKGAVFSLAHDDTPPPPPTPTLPPDDARHLSSKPTFRWSVPDEAVEFQFQLAYDRNFSKTYIDKYTNDVGFRIFSDLAPNTYYWRVRSRDDKGNWSNFCHTRRIMIGRSDGDINGDTYSDIIIGDPTYQVGNPKAGKSYIFFGGKTPDAKADIVLVGQTPGDRFGMQVANLGDLNDDGFDDLGVSAPEDSSQFHRAGRVYIYLGGEQMDDQPDLILSGEMAEDKFGAALTAAGDVNDDGYDDFLVQKSVKGKAEISLYLGGATLDDNPDAIMTSNFTDYDDFFRIGGAKVIAGGFDFNGDGYSDYVLRTLTSSKGQLVYRGYVYYGSETPDSGFDTILVGSTDESGFASEIASAGDLNADGFGDVIMGVAFEPNDEDFAGKALVYLGGKKVSGLPDRVLSSRKVGFGRTVACAGDIDGDKYNDIIVGIGRAYPGEATAEIVWIYLGGPNMSDKPAQIFPADLGDSTLHSTVSPAGRFNGDGNADFVVGLPYGDEEYTYIYMYDARENYFVPLQINTDDYNVFSMFGISIAGPSRCY